ncbi:Hephaestin-like protein [Holothuria leucospilota]|uniref:Hephaestin-like protein n=1 Tax=Holothuria leucospilota TaxID=206669 RepID=A0A9Q1H628_HOLLE|nr:Hephaestin-like protein [Holothuria leucospilota]
MDFRGVFLNLLLISATATATERVYFIGVKEIAWNYTPSGRNLVQNKEFDSYAANYVVTGTDRIGSTYKKSVYRRYTDDTFTEEMTHPEHLGVLGPVISAEVGDKIVIHFKNMGSYPSTMHPHGVFYEKNSEGALYEDGTNGADKVDDQVQPGGYHTYIWIARERAGPSEDNDGCAHWMYHSHIESTFGTNSGLLGPMLICRKGFLRPDGSRRDVDRVFFLMMTVIDENSSHYIQENVNTYVTGNPDDVDLEDGDFLESNLMRSINGYMYGNLPGLEMCFGDRVEWNIFSTGTEVDVHSITFYGNVLTYKGHVEKTIAITPAITTNAIMLARNQGTWIVTSDVTTHFLAGMQALYTINSCGWTPTVPEGLDGEVRRYFIAAVEQDWDYAPTGMNGPYNLTDDSRPEATYFSKTGNRIGGVYRKALFREFTDDTFTTEKLRTAEEEHLGFIGPIIRAEVGDTIEVVFMNNASRNYSIHPQGVHYDKANEGALYNDGSTEHDDDSVAPGSRYQYTWTVPKYLSPTELDEDCITWIYHSHVDVRDTYAGLIGPLLICKNGSLEGGKQKNVDAEFAILFMNVDENWSHYLDDNIQRFCEDPENVDKEDDDFIESNVMRSINGYMYSNLPGLNVCAGDDVSWHVASFGKETDMHMAVFAQQSLISRGLRRDEVPLFPGTMRTFNIKEIYPGDWSLICYVTTHFEGGTQAKINVDEGCGSYSPITRIARNVHYFAAIDIDWDYAPIRYDPVRSQSLDDPESPGNVFVRQDDHLLGSTYKKTVYRQFTDETFSTQSNREESWGILGNPIHAEIGETFDVVFKNLASRPYGFYIHGVRWVNLDRSVWKNGVDPDDTFRYTFSVSDIDGPSDAEGACAPYIYSSPVSHLHDAPTGVVGPLVICREGVLQNGRRTDVDNELFIFFAVFDENKSWYLNENIQRFAGTPDEVDKSDPEFQESNLMHGINGLLYNNLKGLEMTEGETTAWYLMGLGDEVDLHTVHFHGQTIMYRQEGKQIADVYELGPGLTASVKMMSDNPGEWLLHCHVNDHILGGMETNYIVHALPTEPPKTTATASRINGITCTTLFLIIICVMELLF